MLASNALWYCLWRRQATSRGTGTRKCGRRMRCTDVALPSQDTCTTIALSMHTVNEAHRTPSHTAVPPLQDTCITAHRCSFATSDADALKAANCQHVRQQLQAGKPCKRHATNVFFVFCCKALSDTEYLATETSRYQGSPRCKRTALCSHLRPRPLLQCMTFQAPTSEYSCQAHPMPAYRALPPPAFRSACRPPLLIVCSRVLIVSKGYSAASTTQPAIAPLARYPAATRHAGGGGGAGGAAGSAGTLGGKRPNRRRFGGAASAAARSAMGCGCDCGCGVLVPPEPRLCMMKGMLGGFQQEELGCGCSCASETARHAWNGSLHMGGHCAPNIAGGCSEQPVDSAVECYESRSSKPARDQPTEQAGWHASWAVLQCAPMAAVALAKGAICRLCTVKRFRVSAALRCGLLSDGTRSSGSGQSKVS